MVVACVGDHHGCSAPPCEIHNHLWKKRFSRGRSLPTEVTTTSTASTSSSAKTEEGCEFEVKGSFFLGRWIRWGQCNLCNLLKIMFHNMFFVFFSVGFWCMGASGWTNQVLMRGTVDEDDMLLHVTHQKAATEKKKKQSSPQQFHVRPVIGEWISQLLVLSLFFLSCNDLWVYFHPYLWLKIANRHFCRVVLLWPLFDHIHITLIDYSLFIYNI